jgi:NAD(P)-dependent dehydrogenase (short-subunit alcohol dehydrogenase family)
MDELRYDGKVAVITGAGRGLGRAYALLLASRGAKVLVNDAGVVIGSNDDRIDPAAEVVAEIAATGGTAVADDHDVVVDGAAVVEHAIDELGGVDIVINNAGFAGGGPFADLDEAGFDRVFDVHIRGTRAITKAAWPHLARSGAGRIVNASSGSVFGGGGTSAYITGKAAVFGFTRAIAPEGRSVGINVNSIMPCAFTRLTALIPDDTFRDFLADHFQPELIAPFVAWLVHESTEVTGECFSVGGGRAARVFLAEAPGVWLAEGGNPEDWSQEVDALFDVDGFGVPPNMIDEVVYSVRQMGALGGAQLATLSSSDWSTKVRSR